MKKILIIFGGCSYEHEISIKSAQNVYNYIDKEIFDVRSIYISKDSIWYKYSNDFTNFDNLEKIDNIVNYLKEFDLVFNIIHGNTGEDGKIQGFLELFDIKYIGSNSFSSMLCLNKELTKLLLKENNIKQVNYRLYDNIKDIEDNLKYPLIVKPSNGGSSIGITVANNYKELKKAIKMAKKYHHKIIVEEFIKHNLELECSVIKKKNEIYVSTIGQILPASEFYDYNDKYVKEEASIVIPAEISKDISIKIKEIAKKVFTILECRDFARIDFLLDLDNNSIYLNEINTIPGFTNISMFAKLLEYDDIDIKKFFTSLIKQKIS